MILGRELTTSEDFNIAFHLRSELESNILDRFEQELVSFLRNKLKNDKILIRKVISQEGSKQKLYTSSDKYDYLVKQNPKLKDLRDKLGLDFDF